MTDSSSAHNWIECLQRFIRSRLVADVRSRSLVGPASGQLVSSIAAADLGLVQGMVWAVDDQPDFWRESMTTMVNELRSAMASASDTKGDVDRSTCAVYAIWCAIDALLKGTRLPQLRRELERSVPLLVSQTMPLMLPSSDDKHNGAMQSSEEEGRGGGAAPSVFQQEPSPWMWLFLDLLRSWCYLDVVMSDATLRIEEHIRHRLTTVSSQRSVGNSNRGAARTVGPLDGSVRPMGPFVKAEGVKAETGAAVASDHAAAIARVVGALRIATQQSSSSTNTSGSAVLAGDAAVLAFVEELHHQDRLTHTCRVCGAWFDNAAAVSVHTRLHYDYRLRSDDGLHRLPHMTADEFVFRAAPNKTSGAFRINFSNAAEVSRAVRLLGSKRPRASATDSGAADGSYSDPHPRSSGGVAAADFVTVSDAMAVYTCVRCKQSVTPQVGGAGGGWILPGCVEVVDENGSKAVAHTSCL